MDTTHVVTSKGTYLETRLGIRIDHERVEAVLEKIARGLYWAEYHESISVAAVRVRTLIYAAGDETPLELLSHSLKAGTHGWSGVFEYEHGRALDAPYSSVFRFVFYDTHQAVAFTRLRKEA